MLYLLVMKNVFFIFETKFWISECFFGIQVIHKPSAAHIV